MKCRIKGLQKIEHNLKKVAKEDTNNRIVTKNKISMNDASCPTRMALSRAHTSAKALQLQPNVLFVTLQ